MKKINADLKYLVVLWGLIIASLILTFAHHGSIIIDCGREAYYPTQILAGKVLYKDIFNIYGPFSYMFNALLFKIFSINLNVLYIAGCVSAFLIVNLIYIIAKKFMSNFNAFSVAFFTLVIGIFNLHLFNFVFPYSFGMLYGLVFIMISLWSLLKYNEKAQVNYLYLSSFLAGLAVVSKYDFFLYVFVLFYAMFAIKKINFKEIALALFFLIMAPLVSFSILFYQGLTYTDLISSFGLIHKMLRTDTLKYFYSHSGVFPSGFLFSVILKKFVETIIPFIFLVLAFKANIKIFRILLLFAGLFLEFFVINELSYTFLPIVVTLWFVLDFKNIKNNRPLFMLTLTSVLICLKGFWGLILYNYGVFFIPLLFVNIIGLICQKVEDKTINKSVFGLYLLVAGIVFMLLFLPKLMAKSVLLSTDRGAIYASEELAKPSNKLLDYLQKNTDKSDTVVIFPEGLMLNFLADRKSDNYYSSLIPLYVEMFGEDNIIEHFKQAKPDYIIFNNYDTKDYYFKYICKDYAVSFCEYVVDNYKKVLVIQDGLNYNVFKKD